MVCFFNVDCVVAVARNDGRGALSLQRNFVAVAGAETYETAADCDTIVAFAANNSIISAKPADNRVISRADADTVTG